MKTPNPESVAVAEACLQPGYVPPEERRRRAIAAWLKQEELRAEKRKEKRAAALKNRLEDLAAKGLCPGYWWVRDTAGGLSLAELTVDEYDGTVQIFGDESAERLDYFLEAGWTFVALIEPPA